MMNQRSHLRVLLLPDGRVDVFTSGTDPMILDATWAQLNSCPGYRPDDEITSDVRATVLRLSVLDPKDLWQVEAWTHDGVVELRGITRTDWARATLERLIREIAGVVTVRNTVEGLVELASRNQVGTKPITENPPSTSRQLAPVSLLVWNRSNLTGSNHPLSGPP